MNQGPSPHRPVETPPADQLGQASLTPRQRIRIELNGCIDTRAAELRESAAGSVSLATVVPAAKGLYCLALHDDALAVLRQLPRVPDLHDPNTDLPLLTEVISLDITLNRVVRAARRTAQLLTAIERDRGVTLSAPGNACDLLAKILPDLGEMADQAHSPGRSERQRIYIMQVVARVLSAAERFGVSPHTVALTRADVCARTGDDAGADAALARVDPRLVEGVEFRTSLRTLRAGGGIGSARSELRAGLHALQEALRGSAERRDRLDIAQQAQDFAAECYQMGEIVTGFGAVKLADGIARETIDSETVEDIATILSIRMRNSFLGIQARKELGAKPPVNTFVRHNLRETVRLLSAVNCRHPDYLSVQIEMQMMLYVEDAARRDGAHEDTKATILRQFESGPDLSAATVRMLLMSAAQLPPEFDREWLLAGAVRHATQDSQAALLATTAMAYYQHRIKDAPGAADALYRSAYALADTHPQRELLQAGIRLQRRLLRCDFEGALTEADLCDSLRREPGGALSPSRDFNLLFGRASAREHVGLQAQLVDRVAHEPGFPAVAGEALLNDLHDLAEQLELAGKDRLLASTALAMQRAAVSALRAGEIPAERYWLAREFATHVIQRFDDPALSKELDSITLDELSEPELFSAPADGGEELTSAQRNRDRQAQIAMLRERIANAGEESAAEVMDSTIIVNSALDRVRLGFLELDTEAVTAALSSFSAAIATFSDYGYMHSLEARLAQAGMAHACRVLGKPEEAVHHLQRLEGELDAARGPLSDWQGILVGIRIVDLDPRSRTGHRFIKKYLSTYSWESGTAVRDDLGTAENPSHYAPAVQIQATGHELLAQRFLAKGQLRDAFDHAKAGHLLLQSHWADVTVLHLSTATTLAEAAHGLAQSPLATGPYSEAADFSESLCELAEAYAEELTAKDPLYRSTVESFLKRVRSLQRKAA